MSPEEATRNKRILQAEKKGLTDEQNRNLNAAAAKDDNDEALALRELASCNDLPRIIRLWLKLAEHGVITHQHAKEKKILKSRMDSLVARITDTMKLSELCDLCPYGSYPEQLIQERMLNC